MTLRPVREGDLGYFDLWADPADDVFNFFGYGRDDRPERFRQDGGLISEGVGTLLVIVGDDVIGDVSWHEHRYGPPPAGHALNVGIRLLPAHRGKGYGTVAQRRLVDHLFATYRINRVDAGTDVENIAEQRALEKAGFTREGVLRGAQWRAGAWRDQVLYARLRDD